MFQHVIKILCFAFTVSCLASCANQAIHHPQGGATPSTVKPKPIHQQSIAEIQAGYKRGNLTAEQVTAHFLGRIERIDPAVNALIETNPDALDIARQLDADRTRGKSMGPLHGIPVVLKANIDTADKMATSAGALALAAHRAAVDAPLVSALRDAGAIILAKANLSEWANFRDLNSISGWSSIDGQTNNPWRLSHNPCGSSSGSAAAVAARLAPLAVGTETNGSIVCPAGANGVLGLKPSMGRVSRRGIVPIAATQDIAGPMGNSVADLTALMRVLNTHDPEDPASNPSLIQQPIVATTADPLAFKLGIWRNFYGAGESAPLEALFSATLDTLSKTGFSLIDPINLEIPEDLGERSFNKMMYEFRIGIDAYLEGVEEFDSLQQIIEWNNRHADRVLRPFGQDILEMSVALDMTQADFEALEATLQQEAANTLDQALRDLGVTHLLSITNSPAWPTDPEGDVFSVSSSTLAAISGYPHLTIPMGLVEGLPVGLSMVGLPGTEAQLLQLAQLLEQHLTALPLPSGITDVQ